MSIWETFRLSELRLDQQNYRTGETSNQRDAFAAIIEDQEHKLTNLAEDLLAMKGPSPGEPIWVTRDINKRGMYVVLEGNRRVAALKILETPALADGTVVEEAFTILAKQYAENPIRELEACVFPTREEAQPWQRRRHLTSASGVGLQGWKPMAKARANRDQGVKAPRFLAVSEFLQDDSEEWAGLSDVLDSKWTTVDRLLNASTLPTVLGINIDLKTGLITFENSNVDAGKSLLRRVLHEIAKPEFKFAEIDTDVDRENFVNRFAAFSVKLKNKGGPAPKPAPPVKPAPSRRRIKLTLTPRTTLAPKSGSCTFKVAGDRLNVLYKECRKITVKGHENAAALLLRVFIELSSEALLVEKGVSIPNAAARTGKSNWDDVGITLSMKIGAVLDLIDPTSRDSKLQQARVARDPNSQATFSISTLHSYFHNRHMIPDAVAIKEAWDAWENYLRLLHEAR